MRVLKNDEFAAISMGVEIPTPEEEGDATNIHCEPFEYPDDFGTWAGTACTSITPNHNSNEGSGSAGDGTVPGDAGAGA